MILNISEVFDSLQGEGPCMGHPAVFVRLAGCLPPYCKRCDTPYALEGGRQIAVSTLGQMVLDFPAPLVVITGGEPFLQWEQGLSTLVGHLKQAGRTVQFETSGKAGIPESCGGMVVCSPKPMDQPTLSPAFVNRVDQFKFVVADSIEPVLAFQKQHKIEADRIWLMPQGRTRRQQIALMPRVWSFCMTHQFRFSPRLHILTYNDQPGV